MPSAASFAVKSKTAPLEAPANPLHRYVCQSAGLYWFLRDCGDTTIIARDKVDSIGAAVCRYNNQACAGGGGILHGSISDLWLGARMYVGGVAAGIQRVNIQGSLRGLVAVGDVLIRGDPSRPFHSMVVVAHNYGGLFHHTRIRGYNNFGTLHTGAGKAYDNSNRDIDQGRYWHPDPLAPMGNRQLFGYGNTPLYVVPYARYRVRANAVRANLYRAAAGGWVYTGPV